MAESSVPTVDSLVDWDLELLLTVDSLVDWDLELLRTVD